MSDDIFKTADKQRTEEVGCGLECIVAHNARTALSLFSSSTCFLLVIGSLHSPTPSSSGLSHSPAVAPDRHIYGRVHTATFSVHGDSGPYHYTNEISEKVNLFVDQRATEKH